jgi:DNA-binding transcriptional MerR regulator
MPSPQEHEDTFGELYTLEVVERITHISRDRIVHYHRMGLVSAASDPAREELKFDDASVHRLRRLARLLAEYELNDRGLQAFASLLDEVERLRGQMRFLRR